ncbi:MAG: hypothetical protein QOK39_2654 [Acidimicrobiaceae bacterium]|nr:hypothetical protein [Acidimicrobiaceae bacterium]
MRGDVTSTRRAGVAGIVAALVAALVVPYPHLVAQAAVPTPNAPAAPPAKLCGRPALLGPVAPPLGAIVVLPGDNSSVNFSRAGATYWFAPGVHTFGPSEFGQIITANNTTYVGGPGAILDGLHTNRLAFTRASTNVAVRYLTIRNFGVPGGSSGESVVNHDAGSNWTIEYNTIAGNAGAGAGFGNGTVVRFNCLTANGEYGFNAYKAGGVKTITLTHNEISFNDTDDWETRIGGCGCSGAGKFWNVTGATVTNNWVHGNQSVGLFVDTDNIGIRIEGNYIENNSAEGIVYEISYNGRIANNTLTHNAIVKGQTFAARGDQFPIGAIYISESGGDARLNGGVYSTFEITGNNLVDNWGGVVLFENADRFCASPTNGAGPYCALGGAASLTTCAPPAIAQQPYYFDCRWKTQNVLVHDNSFSVSYSAIGCSPTAKCAQQGLLSNTGTTPTWSPYLGSTVEDAVIFGQNNHFAHNSYVGDWRFTAYGTGNLKDLIDWQGVYQQDLDSTQTGQTPPGPGGALDDDTATLEGSIGHWIPWFSSNVTPSTDQAHTGSHSLRVDISAPFGWGVHLDNDPGFQTHAGAKTVSFWALDPAGIGLAVNLTVKWRNSSGADLQIDIVPLLLLGPTWTQGTAALTAPAGTSFVSISLSSPLGLSSNTLYFDDFAVTSN